MRRWWRSRKTRNRSLLSEFSCTKRKEIRLKRRDFLHKAGGLASLAFPYGAFVNFSLSGPTGHRSTGKMIGMYVHQHWPYRHPYAARTWSVEDYRGYADGLRKLGYNMMMIWPLIET